MIDWSDYKNFTEAEFLCHCGCGRADQSPSFMARLQRVRQVYGRPMIVTSGFRCPTHNARVSPKTGLDGPHTTGHAVDIAARGGDVFALVGLAMSQGMTGIGLLQAGNYARYCHLDDLSGATRPWIWTY